MQWSSHWQFKKPNLTNVSSIDRIGGTSAYILKGPTLKRINLPSLSVQYINFQSQ
jgi:hypothetical protein